MKNYLHESFLSANPGLGIDDAAAGIDEYLDRTKKNTDRKSLTWTRHLSTSE